MIGDGKEKKKVITNKIRTNVKKRTDIKK